MNRRCSLVSRTLNSCVVAGRGHPQRGCGTGSSCGRVPGRSSRRRRGFPGGPADRTAGTRKRRRRRAQRLAGTARLAKTMNTKTKYLTGTLSVPQQWFRIFNLARTAQGKKKAVPKDGLDPVHEGRTNVLPGAPRRPGPPVPGFVDPQGAAPEFASRPGPRWPWRRPPDSISTKPNPRGRPVSRSVIRLTLGDLAVLAEEVASRRPRTRRDGRLPR